MKLNVRNYKSAGVFTMLMFNVKDYHTHICCFYSNMAFLPVKCQKALLLISMLYLKSILINLINIKYI
jgi:hypothetical protein